MPTYRVLSVGYDGHAEATETISRATDDEALDAALANIGWYPAIEVWCDDRPLGRISPSETCLE